MAKVLKFPVKKELPKELEERLHSIAKLYVGLLNEVLVAVSDDVTDEEEFDEITNLMLNSLIEGVLKAIEEVNESK